MMQKILSEGDKMPLDHLISTQTLLMQDGLKTLSTVRSDKGFYIMKPEIPNIQKEVATNNVLLCLISEHL